MPVYQYRCVSCGNFEKIRPLSRSGDACACPSCQGLAPRCIVSAPYLGSPLKGLIKAEAINEKARFEPKQSSQTEIKHGPGCGCCGGSSTKISGKTLKNAAGDKMFPTKRPWMISH